VALLQTYLGNTLGTERIPTSLPKKRKKIGPLGHMLHHLIVVEQSFYSYICLRPFSTYANAKAIQLGDLSIVQNRSPLAPFTIYIHETSTLNKAYGIKVWCRITYSKGRLVPTMVPTMKPPLKSWTDRVLP
jgi:hypothetical protein